MIMMTLRVVVIAALAVLVSCQNSTAPGRFICDCPGEEAKDYVCGVDGQTYGNECLLKCSNIALKNKGECQLDGCFPWGESNCNGNFDDHNPVCALGLTWDGVAEANCDGTGFGKTCTTKGVCNYRDDGQPSVLATTGGKGLDWKAAANNTNPPARDTPSYDYSEALGKLLLYYDSMISGNLTAPGVCRRRLTWRSDSCTECIGKFGEDLSGGFYEAGGSTLKYPSIISGFSGTMLAWIGLEFGEAIQRAGSMEDLKWKVKWAADHVIAAHPEPEVFVGFLGNQTDDFDFWGPAEYYDQYNPPRVIGYVTKDEPGTEVVADAAATLASAVVLLGDEDPEWKSKAMEHAVQLYEFGKKYPRSYAESKDPGIKIMNDMYASNNGFEDDMAWAALWMYKATRDASYLKDAKDYFSKAPPMAEGDSFETGYKTPGVAILLAQADKQDTKALDGAKKYFDSYLTGNVAHTVGGAAYPYHWGANRHVGNLGFLTFVHAKNEAVDSAYANRLRNYGIHEANYLLGDAGRSWVIGFGKDYPTMHNHKMSYYSILNWHPDPTQEPLGEKIWMTDVAGPFAPENPTGYVQRAKFDFEGSRTPQAHIAWGTLFGSPLFDDGLINTRRDYTYAESTVEYNAAAVGAIAAMADWYGSGPYTGVESLEGVIPFTCDQPQTPWSTPLAPAPAPVAAPTPAPAPALPLAPPAAVVPVQPTENSNSENSVNGGGAAAVVPSSAGFQARMSFAATTLAIFLGLVLA